MKNVIGGIVLTVMIFGCLIWAFSLTNQYKKQGEVIQVTRCGILFEDMNGDLWAIDYEKGYKVGDKVLIILDSQGTWETKEDDVIVRVDRAR